MNFNDLMKFEEMNKYFLDIWEYENPIGIKHTKNNWNTWAQKWEENFKQDDELQNRTIKRVNSSIDFLKQHNALNKDFDVIDIGCGPFRFVCEFANHVKSSTGLDHSDIMVENGINYAKSLNLNNVKGIVGDFKSMNTSSLCHNYDLAFSFVTPAIKTFESLKKFHNLSKKYCFNGCFIETVNQIRDEVQNNVFNVGVSPTHHGNWYYCLWNILWLSGYNPISHYYTEEYYIEEKIDDEFITYITNGIFLNTKPSNIDYEKTYDYLIEHYPSSLLTNYKKNVYGYILWDVSDKKNYTYKTLL